MTIILWLVTGASLVTSLVAIRGVRRATKRYQELSHLYWELRYQQGELRAQIQSGASAPPTERSSAPPRAAAEAFVPLSAVKR